MQSTELPEQTNVVKQSRRRFLERLAAYGLSAISGAMLWEFFGTLHSERRFTLYNIQRELKKGMIRSQVLTVINRHDAPFVHKSIKPNSISLWVFTGAADACLLAINFKNGRVVRAGIRGEDGPHEIFYDAPEDIT